MNTALVQQVALQYGLPIDLLTAQIQIESGGDPNAFRYEHDFFTRYIVGNADAKAAKFGPLAACSYGMLQILLEVAYELGFDGRPEDLFEPRVGLAWGSKKMKALWDASGGGGSTYRVALAAYNGGQSLLHVPESSWPVAVQGYVDKVYAAVKGSA
jgi:soluble lytic murein transglycosylase-like protein